MEKKLMAGSLIASGVIAAGAGGIAKYEPPFVSHAVAASTSRYWYSVTSPGYSFP
jgi:hypothetical protein